LCNKNSQKHGDFEVNNEDNLEIINKAFRLILPPLTEYIGSTLCKIDNTNWWKKCVINILPATSTINLPKEGTYDECIGSLDILACLNIITNTSNWQNIFRYQLEIDPSYAHELKAIRHKTAHPSAKTLKTITDAYVERALDTMALFMGPINKEMAKGLQSKKSDFKNKNIISVITSNSADNKPVNPSYKCKIFIFSIGTIGMKRDKNNVYEATRKYWEIIDEYRDVTEYEFAVGLINGISIGSYRIKNWIYEKYGHKDKYKFDGEEIIDFLNLDWNKQIGGEAKGHWQFGRHLVVEFDGNGKFRYIKGSKNKQQWFCCL
jgi:hypothetical protein